MLADGRITMDQFKQKMGGIFSTSVHEGTIDESPMAYKPFSMIEEHLRETVEIEEIVKPVYNLKAQYIPVYDKHHL